MAENEPLVETVVIDGDDEPLRKKLEGMASWMQSWGKKIGAVGAGIGALGGSVQAALSKAANDLAGYSAGLDKQIKQHNVSAEALGAMKLQADQTGGSLDEMLRNGTRATAEFQVAAEKLGVTMSGENVAAGVALSRALARQRADAVLLDEYRGRCCSGYATDGTDHVNGDRGGN